MVCGSAPDISLLDQQLVNAVSLALDSVVKTGADVTIAVKLLGRETLPLLEGVNG
jgi:hypothetical protein